MGGYFHQMPGGSRSSVSPEAAEHALALLGEMSADLRAAAILAADGEVLASDGPAAEWAQSVSSFLSIADEAEGNPVEQAHIATEAGEVFALRIDGLVAVAVTERFTLASLMAFDMRSLLRDLAGTAQVDSATTGANGGGA